MGIIVTANELPHWFPSATSIQYVVCGTPFTIQAAAVHTLHLAVVSVVVATTTTINE